MQEVACARPSCCEYMDRHGRGGDLLWLWLQTLSARSVSPRLVFVLAQVSGGSSSSTASSARARRCRPGFCHVGSLARARWLVVVGPGQEQPPPGQAPVAGLPRCPGTRRRAASARQFAIRGSCLHVWIRRWVDAHSPRAHVPVPTSKLVARAFPQRSKGPVSEAGPRRAGKRNTSRLPGATWQYVCPYAYEQVDYDIVVMVSNHLAVGSQRGVFRAHLGTYYTYEPPIGKAGIGREARLRRHAGASWSVSRYASELRPQLSHRPPPPPATSPEAPSCYPAGQRQAPRLCLVDPVHGRRAAVCLDACTSRRLLQVRPSTIRLVHASLARRPTPRRCRCRCSATCRQHSQQASKGRGPTCSSPPSETDDQPRARAHPRLRLRTAWWPVRRRPCPGPAWCSGRPGKPSRRRQPAPPGLAGAPPCAQGHAHAQAGKTRLATSAHARPLVQPET